MGLIAFAFHQGRIASSGRHRGATATVSRLLLFAALVAVLSGCVTAAEREAARRAWDAHDAQGAARCGGRSIDGVCLSGGGP